MGGIGKGWGKSDKETHRAQTRGEVLAEHDIADSNEPSVLAVFLADLSLAVPRRSGAQKKARSKDGGNRPARVRCRGSQLAQLPTMPTMLGDCCHKPARIPVAAAQTMGPRWHPAAKCAPRSAGFVSAEAIRVALSRACACESCPFVRCLLSPLPQLTLRSL